MSNARKFASSANQPARLRVLPTEGPAMPAARHNDPAESLPALARPRRGLFLVPAGGAPEPMHPLARAFAEPTPTPALSAHLRQGAESLAEARRIVAQIEEEIEARAARDRNAVRARLHALEAAHNGHRAGRVSALRSAFQRLARTIGF